LANDQESSSGSPLPPGVALAAKRPGRLGKEQEALWAIRSSERWVIMVAGDLAQDRRR
jgi:hypothetical protein